MDKNVCPRFLKADNWRDSPVKWRKKLYHSFLLAAILNNKKNYEGNNIGGCRRRFRERRAGKSNAFEALHGRAKYPGGEIKINDDEQEKFKKGAVNEFDHHSRVISNDDRPA
jgi:hypothetical protein